MNYCGKGGANDLCFGNISYKTLNPNIEWSNSPSTYQSYVTARLDNGFIIWLYSSSDNCNTEEDTSLALKHTCGGIGVDINGYKNPNALGKDTFYFLITKYGIVPTGTKDNTHYPINSHCKLSSNNNKNGYACTAWVIEKGNMDYLHKEVHW